MDELKKVKELKAILKNDGTDIYSVYNKMVNVVDRVSCVCARPGCEGSIILKRENGEEKKFWYFAALKDGYHKYLRNIAELTGLEMTEVLLLFHRDAFTCC